MQHHLIAKMKAYNFTNEPQTLEINKLFSMCLRGLMKNRIIIIIVAAATWQIYLEESFLNFFFSNIIVDIALTTNFKLV